MKNIKPILLHEIQNYLHSFKFVLLLIISAVVTIVCVYAQITDFNDKQESYLEEVRKANELKETFRVYSDYKIPILIPPNPLSIYAKGVENEAGSKSVISITDMPELEKTSVSSNPFMAIFSEFDVISIVSILFSLLIILLVADAISGERDAQTLKMIFANRTGRFEYYLAKYMGALIMAAIPLFTIFFISMLLIILEPLISVNISFFIRVFFLFLISVFFASVFILVSLFISAGSKSGVQSVMSGLFVWLIVMFIYPNLVNYTISAIIEKPSRTQLKSSISAVEEKFVRDNFDWYIEHYHGKPSHYFIAEGFQYFPLSFFSKFISLTQKYEFEFQEKHIKERIPVFIEMQRKILDLKSEYESQLLKPVEVSAWFNFFIPSHILQLSAEKISGTDRFNRDVRIRNEIKTYRNTILDYLKDRDAFGLRFFTRVEPKDMQDDINDYSEAIREKYNHVKDYEPLQFNDAPRYSYKIAYTFPLLELGILLLLNLVLFVLGAKRFIHSSIL